MIFTLVIIFLLLVCSAVFSCAETAITAASRPRMHALRQKGNRRAMRVAELQNQIGRVINAVLVGNTLVNIVASALATGAMITIFGENGVAFAAIGMTVLVVLVGEVLPKTYAINNADRTALALAPLLRAVVTVLIPVTAVMQAIVGTILRLVGLGGRGDKGAEHAEQELRGAIDLHTGAVKEVRKAGQMLHSILDLRGVTVGDVIIHRRNVVAVDVGQSPTNIVAEVLASPYTRVPLWRDNPDNVIGVLHVKSLLRAIQVGEDPADKLDIAGLATPPWFIPDTTSLLAQLHAFRERREHLALVVDEYGALLGIVTIEDILEEIVGDIVDELDISVAGVRPEPDGAYLVDGTVTIRDLNREFGWRLPDENASTVAGLVLHEARCIPDQGRVFVFHGMRFEILERHRNQLRRLRLKPLTPKESAAPPETDAPAATD
jgi:Mg2+/Co2+ transporter CorB